MNEDNSLYTPLKTLNAWIRRSFFLKCCMIAFILLVCQIPMLMVSELTRSRRCRQMEVEGEVSSKWGGSQLITGPLLALPISRRWTEQLKNGSSKEHLERNILYAVPETLTISGQMDPECRYRGIYEVILYRSQLKLVGAFGSVRIPEGWTADVSGARILVGISDMIGLSGIDIQVGNAASRAVPGIDAANAPFRSGITVPVTFVAGTGELTFQAAFNLNGCRELSFTPLGKMTDITLSSPWRAPSFCGGFLPAERVIGEDGFRATWKISEFNRNIPQTWLSSEKQVDIQINAGVSLVKQADVYSQVTRAATYSILIFLIVLMAFLIAERLTKTWMHPLQYCLAALSLVLFYAMTLALSEHVPFAAAYWLSTAAVTGLCAFYCALIFRRKDTVFATSAAVVASYAVIFVLLRMEDYALLAGALVMFVLLGILMGMTGRMNRE